jgi:hypothetical protein
MLPFSDDNTIAVPVSTVCVPHCGSGAVPCEIR